MKTGQQIREAIKQLAYYRKSLSDRMRRHADMRLPVYEKQLLAYEIEIASYKWVLNKGGDDES